MSTVWILRSAREVAAVVNAVDSPRRTPTQVAVVIPAKDEADQDRCDGPRLPGAPHVDLVVVVDDRSSDGDRPEAVAAGAEVIRHQTNSGKSAAMTSGAATPPPDAGGPPRALLFVDADLGESVDPRPAHRARGRGHGRPDRRRDPRSHSSKGTGRAVRLARNEIRRRTGVEITQPLERDALPDARGSRRRPRHWPAAGASRRDASVGSRCGPARGRGSRGLHPPRLRPRLGGTPAPGQATARHRQRRRAQPPLPALRADPGDGRASRLFASSCPRPATSHPQ